MTTATKYPSDLLAAYRELHAALTDIAAHADTGRPLTADALARIARGALRNAAKAGHVVAREARATAAAYRANPRDQYGGLLPQNWGRKS